MLSTPYTRRIRLANFRKYREAAFNFEPGLNIITGRNGVGKTNLLDAVYYSCLARSYFTGQDQLVFSFDSDFFRVETEISQGADLHKIEIKNIKLGKKEVLLDGVLVDKLSEFVGRFPVVFVTPDDNQLVLGASDNRRRLVDATLCQVNPEYLNNLLKYNKLLAQRNALLKFFAETRRVDDQLLQTYNEKLVPPGQYLYEQRKAFNGQYIELFNRLYSGIFTGAEEVSITYDSSLNNIDFQKLIENNTKADFAAQRTTAGIHTDDWIFTLNGFPVKKTGSQGQQKTFLLALKLAQYEYISRAKETKPFLLLDDIFDKLDRHRTAQLINLVNGGSFGQVFITDTDKSRIQRILDENGISSYNQTELTPDAQ